MITKEFASNIKIKAEETIAFSNAWDNLMTDFKIPESNQLDLSEIMQDFFFTFDHDVLYIYEFNCAIDALDFFIQYANSFERIKHKGAFEIDKVAKVRFEIAGPELEFKYPGISQITINALYTHMRNNDSFLHSMLRDFKMFPNADELRAVREELGNKREDKLQYYFQEQLEKLKGYINTNLSLVLSRKVNYFIFEILYLFNIIQYSGIVLDVEGKTYAIGDSKSSNNKFSPLHTIDSKQKTAFITNAVINAVKRYNSNNP